MADTIVPYIFNPQSLNRYAYVLNNPLRYTDPDGLIVRAAYDAVKTYVLEIQKAFMGLDSEKNNSPYSANYARPSSYKTPVQETA